MPLPDLPRFPWVKDTLLKPNRHWKQRAGKMIYELKDIQIFYVYFAKIQEKIIIKKIKKNKKEILFKI